MTRRLPALACAVHATATAARASHITIAHNHRHAGRGMSIGSETNGGVSAILAEDLTSSARRRPATRDSFRFRNDRRSFYA